MFLAFQQPYSLKKKTFLLLLHGTGVPFLSTAFKPSSRTLTYLSLTPQLRKRDSNLFSPYFTWIFLILFTQQPYFTWPYPLPQNTGLEPASPYFTWISLSSTLPGHQIQPNSPLWSINKTAFDSPHVFTIISSSPQQNLELRSKELSPIGVQWLPN